jgi:uncharacterized membrane protein YfcA
MVEDTQPMSILLTVTLGAVMLGTAFLSGIFGMAGGLILMGVLIALLSVPEAMALHAITQMASNGWRAFLWIRYVKWWSVGVYLAGALIAFAVWAVWRWVPSKPVALLLLGATPFVVRLLPSTMKPDPQRLSHGIVYGMGCMSLMLTTGVAGPLVDSFFLGGHLDRRQVVATKAMAQMVSHAAKLAYFGGLIADPAGLDPVMAVVAVLTSMAGTTLARPVLERLSDVQYRTWATHMITVIAIAYLAQGGYLLIWPGQ